MMGWYETSTAEGCDHVVSAVALTFSHWMVPGTRRK
jgi:hypothetical protein